MRRYTSTFFETIESDSEGSARLIVPMVLELLSPSSVVDVGCGTGGWLREFGQRGCEIMGVDGAYVDRSSLRIPAESFLASNLNEPLHLHRTFDLVTSLEVAEHLSLRHAEQFIDSLVRHGKLVLFSAAIPFQGGTNHVNEQWPDFWAEKFSNRGYVCIDYFRTRLWELSECSWWFAQNLLLFVKEEELKNSRFSELQQWLADPPRRLVHPQLYIDRCLCKHLDGTTLLKLTWGRLTKRFRPTQARI